MSQTLYRGALTPKFRADPQRGAPLAPVWTESLSVPSSGNSRLLRCYAGTDKWVYRKARTSGNRQEYPFDGSRRAENKWTGASFSSLSAGNGITATITTGRPDAFGGNTAIRIQGTRSTADTSNYSGASVAITEAAIAPAGGTVRVSYWARSASGAAHTAFFSGGGASLGGTAIALTTAWQRVSPAAQTPASGSAHYIQVLGYGADAALSIDVEICGIQAEDLSGMDQTVPSEYVDTSTDYGVGCAGVRHFGTTCNVSVSNGIVTEATGIPLSIPMGIGWRPAATGQATNSPPSMGTNVTVAAAPAPIAGLPAMRMTSVGSNAGDLHYASITGTVAAGSRQLSVIARKPATGGAIPCLQHTNGTWNAVVQPSSGWVASEVRNDTSSKIASHRLVALGNDDYLLEMVVTTSSESTPQDLLYVGKAGGVIQYVSGGELLDVASFNSWGQGWGGGPMLASGSQTASLADDPATALESIGTRDVTVFVHATINRPSINAPLFSAIATAENGSSQFGIYGSAGSLVINHDPAAISSAIPAYGTPFKLAVRRSGGQLSAFLNGALLSTVSATVIDLSGTPRFGPRPTVGMAAGPAVFHDYWIEYSGLSDNDCKRVTRV